MVLVLSVRRALCYIPSSSASSNDLPGQDDLQVPVPTNLELITLIFFTKVLCDTLLTQIVFDSPKVVKRQMYYESTINRKRCLIHK